MCARLLGRGWEFPVIAFMKFTVSKLIHCDKVERGVSVEGCWTQK